MTDFRHLNLGRPNDKNDKFFQKLGKIIEDVKADDRNQHGVAHLAKRISLDHIIQEKKHQLPPDALMPSKSLVSL